MASLFLLFLVVFCCFCVCLFVCFAYLLVCFTMSFSKHDDICDRLWENGAFGTIIKLEI